MNLPAAFLEDIVQHAADDAPRLIYADWLDEHGDPERAEFIRVQCELATGITCEAPWNSNAPPVPAARCHQLRDECRCCTLNRRERELLNQHALMWLEGLPDPPGPWLCVNTHPNALLPGPKAFFCRGFIAAVHLKVEDWCGAPCVNCGHSRWITAASCPHCHGTGRSGGPVLVQRAPLERVLLTDWGNALDARLPLDLRYRLVQSAAVTQDAISAACLAWATQRTIPREMSA